MGSPAIIAQDNCAHSARYFGRYGDVVYHCAIRFTAACWCFLFLLLLNVAPANAQITIGPEQGWSGILYGSNDYTIPINHETQQDACASFEYTYVPQFGFEVYELISISPAEAINNRNGEKVAAFACLMNAGENGYGNIYTLHGCDQSTTLVDRACLPPSYPVDAEPICGGPTDWADACPTVGDPVSIVSGAKVEMAVDYASGGPFPIEIKRFYRSLLMPQSGELDGMGLAWRSSLLGRRIEIRTPLADVVVRREDGMKRRFLNQYNLTDPYQPGEYEYFFTEMRDGYSYGGYDHKDRLKHIGNGVYEYIDENDRVDRFESVGGSPTVYQLTQSTWKGGHQRFYQYDQTSPNQLTQITDSFGRVISLTWVGDQVSEIELPDGTTIVYGYDLQVKSGAPVAGTEALVSVTRYAPDGSLVDTKGYQYDRTSPGTSVPLLTGIVDAKGVVVDTTTYDPIGRVLTAQGPNGANFVSIDYVDNGGGRYGNRIVTNALGQQIDYSVDRDDYGNNPGNNLKVTRTRVVKSSTVTIDSASEYYYDKGHSTDQFGRWFYVYDPESNYYRVNNEIIDEDLRKVEPTQIIEDGWEFWGGVIRTYDLAWEPEFRALSQVAGPNLTVNLAYDSDHRLTRREEIDTVSSTSRAWDYTYNSLGLLESVTGPRTDLVQTTSFTYDSFGNVATVTNPLGHVTTVNTVDAAGRPTSITDSNGVNTSMSYDALGRVEAVTVHGPVDATSSFGYDADGLLISTTSPEGIVLTYDYDAAHRLVGLSDSNGNSMVFTLDGLGNRTQTQIIDGTSQVLMTQSATYDSLGRLLTNIGAYGQTTSYAYDRNDNLLEVVDPRSAVTQFAYDGLDRAIQTTNALSGVTLLARDLQDNLTSVTDARGNQTTYEVNGFGFIIKADSPDNGVTTYTHDLAGNILTSKDAKRITTTYTYDALDRPLTRSYGVGAIENVTYVYDETAGGNHGIGRLTSVIDEAGSATFEYDAYGHRISETRLIAGISYTTDYSYDLDGQLAQVVYPSGLSVVYQRDTLGQVIGVTAQTDGASPLVSIATNGTYVPFGPLEGMTLGNGVQVTRTYDLDYRLANIQAVGTTTVQDLTLAYDLAGAVATIDDALSPALDQAFQYDLLGRITQATGVYGQDDYTYDATGNRLTRTLIDGGTTSASFSYASTSNVLTSAQINGTGTAYSNDANGSRTRSKTGSGKNAIIYDYGYNNAGRLSSVGAVSYKYNAFGERAVMAEPSGATHLLFNNDGQLIAEHTAQGALIRNFIYLNGQPFAVVDATGAVSYILNDHLGQPQKMLDAVGNVSWHRVAGVFGDTVSQLTGTTQANPLRFPGQYHDAASGLHYNYFRDYDPATGRYLETDSLGIAGGLNLYEYAGSAPTTNYDSKGLYLESGIDLAFIGYDLWRLLNDNVLGDPCAPGASLSENMKALGLDIAGLMVPGATGLGMVGRAKKTAPIWSSTNAKSAAENALGHWNKHKSEFPEYLNSKQYVEGAAEFINNPPSGTLTKARPNGDELFYNPSSNTFAVKNSNGSPRTMFRPGNGMNYWNNQ